MDLRFIYYSSMISVDVINCGRVAQFLLDELSLIRNHSQVPEAEETFLFLLDEQNILDSNSVFAFLIVPRL
jgi:hypothetical protein